MSSPFKLPFSLSVITDEISQDPDIAIDLAKSFHFQGVELRSAWDLPVEQLPESQINALAARLCRDELQVSAIASSFLKDDWPRIDLEKYKRIVRACAMLNCHTIRAFSFWQTAAYSDSAFYDILCRIDTLLQNDGIQMVLENDPSVNLSTGSDLARFFKQYTLQNIGVLWDPGNDVYTLGETAVPFPDEYFKLQPFIRHVHIKDAVYLNGEGVGVALGNGLVDYYGQFKALITDGYHGWVTLEPHFRFSQTIDEELLKRPGGAAFSKGGYLPTKLCMENLNRILNSVIGEQADENSIN